MPLRKIHRRVVITTRAFPGTATPQPDAKSLAMDTVRPPAVAAGCRWWFRALAGGILGTTDLKAIRDGEDCLFGGNKRASAIRLSIIPHGEIAPRGGIGRGYSKISYLAYGKSDYQAYLPAGFEFSLAVMCPQQHQELFEAILNLWIAIGGVGGRWRHGLGAMRRIDAESAPVPDLLRTGRAAMAACLKAQPPERIDKPKFSVVHPDWLILAESALEGNEQQALNAVESAYHRIRIDPRATFARSFNSGAFHDFVDHNEQGDIQMAMLGLPLPFSASRNNGRGGRGKGIVVWATADQKDEGRLASPVWLRPVKGTGQTDWRLTALGWKFDAARGRCLLVRDAEKGKNWESCHKWSPAGGTDQPWQVDHFFEYLESDDRRNRLGQQWKSVDWAQNEQVTGTLPLPSA